MSLSAFLLAILVSSAAYTAADPMFNLEFDKYQGTWYLIQFANFPDSGGGESLPCLQESYNRKADNPYIVEMLWSGGSEQDGTKQELNGIVTFNYPTGEGPWQMYIDGAHLVTHILFTDYTNWAVEHTAGSYNGSFFDRVMIRSRTTSLDATVLDTLHTIITGLGLDYRFYDVDHSVC